MRKQKINLTPPHVKLGLGSLAILFALKNAARDVLEIFSQSRAEVASYKSIRADLSADRETVFDYYEILKNLHQNSLKTILWRLSKKGLVEKEKGKYTLTGLGLKFLKRWENDKTKEKEWDGKWRLLAFDIPEALRRHRDWLRFQLLSLGYKSLQKSLFLGKRPFNRDLIEELHNRSLQEYIHLMTLGEIDDEEALKDIQ